MGAEGPVGSTVAVEVVLAEEGLDLVVRVVHKLGGVGLGVEEAVVAGIIIDVTSVYL